MNLSRWEIYALDDTTLGSAHMLTDKLFLAASLGAYPSRIDVCIDWRPDPGVREALSAARLGLPLAVLYNKMLCSVFAHVSAEYENLFNAAHIQNMLAAQPLLSSITTSVSSILAHARTRDPTDPSTITDTLLSAPLPRPAHVRARPPPLVLSDDVLASIPPTTPPLPLSTPVASSIGSSPSEWATPRSMPSSPLAA